MQSLLNLSDLERCASLDPTRKAAWVRVLSAIQTSELMEFQVLEPLLAHYQNDAQSTQFLSQQSVDEKRHSDLLRAYLLSCFGYVKSKPTLSDRFFYSVIFPLARRFLFGRVLYGVAVILFYERFSVGLYVQLLKIARQDGLHELAHIIDGILKDEAGHINGLRHLIKRSATRESNILPNSFLLRLVLILASADVNFSRWALHNRQIRKQLQMLDVDPDLINGRRKKAVSRVASLILANEIGAS